MGKGAGAGTGEQRLQRQGRADSRVANERYQKLRSRGRSRGVSLQVQAAGLQCSEKPRVTAWSNGREIAALGSGRPAPEQGREKVPGTGKGDLGFSLGRHPNGW